MREFGDRDTVWVGPVQGGLFPRLLDRSARSLLKAGFGFLALGSPVQVMENYRFADLARMIVATKQAIPYSTPLHLFGAGHPLTMALAVALGCDTFDSASYILFAREGRYMTERGVLKLDAMKFLPCACRVCQATSVKDLNGLGRNERTKLLATHNLLVLRKEVEACKEAISEGRLWDLVREKAVVHPKLLEALSVVAEAGARLGDGTPPMKDRGLFLRDRFDSGRPELAAARKRLAGTTPKSSRAAVLLDVGGSVPYSKLRLSGRIPEGADVYRIHPVLGPYPVELDFVYPFTQTVATGGPREGEDRSTAVAALRRMGYDRVAVAEPDSGGRLVVSWPRSRRRPKGSSPSAPSSSSRPRSPRRP